MKKTAKGKTKRATAPPAVLRTAKVRKQKAPKAWPKYLAISDLSTKLLRHGLDYLKGEMDACDSGIVPEERPLFYALALVVDTELRFRDPRRTRHV